MIGSVALQYNNSFLFIYNKKRDTYNVTCSKFIRVASLFGSQVYSGRKFIRVGSQIYSGRVANLFGQGPTDVGLFMPTVGNFLNTGQYRTAHDFIITGAVRQSRKLLSG
jgi:hypothetical protein